MSRPQRPPNFQNVKWRFLSEAALGPKPVSQPWTDDSRKRIGHLEKALASTHDLEAQYQSFLQEVSKIDPAGTTFDGVGPGWGGVPGAPAGALPEDLIPSDPADESDALPVKGSKFAPIGGAPVSSAAAGAAGSSGAGASGDGAGEHSAEDDEVARVQMLAAAAAGGESSDVKGREADSPSPVIIWRHAAPVKIATNVPTDLLTDTENAQLSARQATSERPQIGGGGRGPPKVEEAPVNPGVVAYRRRMAYGVWYLPKEQWQSRAFAAGGAPSAASEKADAGKEGKDGKKGKGEAAASDAAADLADTIPKLYSSRIYKDFLKTQKVPNNRIPSYLQQVDSPKSPDSPKEKSSSPSPRKGVKIADEAES